MSNEGDGNDMNPARSKFMLRFDNEAQHQTLKARAARNRRTLNAELLFLIDRGIEAVDGEEKKT